MRRHVLRTAGPAVVLVFEVEATTRAYTTAENEAEAAALDRWIEEAPPRFVSLLAALADRRRVGGPDAQRQWADVLAGRIGFPAVD